MNSFLQINFISLLLVFCGGMLGALSRFALTAFYFERFELNNLNFIFLFPLDILFINVLGSFALGLFLNYLLIVGYQGQYIKNFLAVGFLGSFTTFATFILDSLIFIIPFLAKFDFFAKKDFFYQVLSTWITIIPLNAQSFILENSLALFLITILSNLLLCVFAYYFGYWLIKK